MRLTSTLGERVALLVSTAAVETVCVPTARPYTPFCTKEFYTWTTIHIVQSTGRRFGYRASQLPVHPAHSERELRYSSRFDAVSLSRDGPLRTRRFDPPPHLWQTASPPPSNNRSACCSRLPLFRSACRPLSLSLLLSLLSHTRHRSTLERSAAIHLVKYQGFVNPKFWGRRDEISATYDPNIDSVEPSCKGRAPPWG